MSNITQAAHPLDIEVAKKRLQALRLREAGITYRRIAEELGIAVSWAYQLVTDALKDLNEAAAETAAQVRVIEGNRLDNMWRKLEAEQLNPDGTEKPVNISIMMAQLEVMKRRAKLQGLDAPVQVAMPGTVPLASVDDLRQAFRDRIAAQRKALQAVSAAGGEVTVVEQVMEVPAVPVAHTNGDGPSTNGAAP